VNKPTGKALLTVCHRTRRPWSGCQR
jgi:hypothetical protein